MKSPIILLIFFIYTMSTYTQNNKGVIITGTILEKSTENPLEFATIGIYNLDTEKFIAGTSSNTAGRFTFDSLPIGNYYITYHYTGYEKQKSAPFSIKDYTTSVDIGKLYLVPSVQALNEVVVQGKRSIYIQSIDKKTFNVGQDLMSSSGSASDLMQNIPSVQVDVEGNVSLRGNENVQILINGKPSTLMNARTRADVLQQLPASNIERIEVITNPSAQYKPDGVSGIINIVMKKKQKKRINGSVTANVGLDGRYNTSAYVNYNIGKVNLFANYGIRLDRRDRTTYDNRMKSDSTLSITDQETTSKASPLSHIIRAGIDWNIDSKNMLQLSGGYNHRSFVRKDNISTRSKDALQEITYEGIRYRYDDEKTKQLKPVQYILILSEKITASS